ncbi:ATP-binding cassette domain-containing protein [Gulosibacter hominis]|uniref:ATP-binding cassette domain-containing protein n=1 Tax=Gulosibacter hominis TaxID=2770504 RepID=UPI00191A9A52|nr:ATP-binding cassette domain-containing protein [Gulosibacter hominis]
MATQAATGTAIIADDLSVSYGRKRADASQRVISGVSFELARGEILGIVGTAGSGKTALGRVLSGRGLLGRGADWPWISGGGAQVAGIDLRNPSAEDLRRLSLDVGYLAQESGNELRVDLTVAENIAEPILSRDRNFDRKALGRAAAMLIDAVDLELGVLNRYPHELSRGQRQRVAFAQALIVEPAVLIVDEPAQGIDIIARPALFSLLERLNRARALTMIVISNDLATIERLTRNILIVDDGRVIAQGDIDEALGGSADGYLRRLRDAREFSRAPLPGLVNKETVAAAERVVEGLFVELSAEDERERAEEAARDQLVENRPEFARFFNTDAESASESETVKE